MKTRADVAQLIERRLQKIAEAIFPMAQIKIFDRHDGGFLYQLVYCPPSLTTQTGYEDHLGRVTLVTGGTYSFEMHAHDVVTYKSNSITACLDESSGPPPLARDAARVICPSLTGVKIVRYQRKFIHDAVNAIIRDHKG